MPVEIKAGPELNRAVAEACEYVVYHPPSCCFPSNTVWVQGEVPEWYSSEILTSNPPYWAFHPSTDLNAAFAAAERVGLFGNERRECHILRRDDLEGHWVITLPLRPDTWVDVSSEATPALVICAAILKLKES